MKNKKEINVQTTIAQNTESKPTTTQSDFDFVSKMENYDFSTLYAEYKYDKICQDNKRMYGLNGLDARLPTFEMALQTFAVDFPDDLKDRTIKTYFYNLPKCGFHLFDEACFMAIPDFAKPRFIDIYLKFRRYQNKNHPNQELTAAGPKRAADVIWNKATDITETEKIGMVAFNAIQKDAQDFFKWKIDAIKEYFAYGAPWGTLFECPIEEARKGFVYSLVYDFIMRHHECLVATAELLLLRNKIRKKLNLGPNEYVGF